MSAAAIQVGTAELRSNLSTYLRKAREGVRIQVRLRGEVVAELRAPETLPPRRLGLMKGEIWMAEDFNDTPQDIIDMMEGKFD